MVKACVPEPMVIAVPELLHVYPAALHVQYRKRAPLLLVKVCVPETMVIAVPELLHVYFDAVYCSNAREPASHWSRVAPWPLNQW